MSSEITTQVMQAVVTQGSSQRGASNLATSDSQLNRNTTEPMPTGVTVEAGQDTSATGNKLPVADLVEKNNADAGQISEEQLEKVVSKMNDFVQSLQRDLKFSVDDGSGKTIVKVIDATTDEVLRQIPSEEALEILHRLQESRGLIFQKEA